MFPKKQRVPKSVFEKSIRTGSRKVSPHFTLTTTPSPDQTAHHAVVVSKKVAGTAVLRNKTRRRVFQALRLSRHSKNEMYIIFAKKGDPELSYKILEEEIHGLVK